MHILNDVSLGSRGEGAGAKAIIPLVCYICVRRGGKKVFWTKRGVANPQTPPLYPPLIIGHIIKLCSYGYSHYSLTNGLNSA